MGRVACSFVAGSEPWASRLAAARFARGTGRKSQRFATTLTFAALLRLLRTKPVREGLVLRAGVCFVFVFACVPFRVGPRFVPVRVCLAHVRVLPVLG